MNNIKKKILFLGYKDSLIFKWLKDIGESVIQSSEKITPQFIHLHNIQFIISYRYGYILKKNILDLFPNRAINLHISYLPWNRGADPNLWSFVENTPKGVTIHYLDQGVDTGDIIIQKKLEFDIDNETLATSYRKLQTTIQQLFKQNWQNIKNEQCKKQKQKGKGSLHKIKDKNNLSCFLTKKWDTPLTEFTQLASLTNIYPKNGHNPTIINSDNTKPNIGFCFSGGGSRALTCAWGQLLGLKNLNIIDKARYISSVSGGTWALSIYNYLPDNISDTELLGTYYPPENLSLTDSAGKLNVNTLSKHSLGRAPAGMGVEELFEAAVLFLLFNSTSDYKWLWAYIVGKFILDPFELRAKGENVWASSKYFSLSQNYATKNFPTQAPLLKDFFFLRKGRPFLIMNNNIMEKVQITNKDISNIVQLPSQVTPISGGAQGQTPDLAIIGGGSVESYGNNSILQQNSADESPVKIRISQPYSLIDIVSTSSAFFAATIANLIKTNFNDPKKLNKLIKQINGNLKEEQKNSLIAKAEKEFSEQLNISEFIEKYLEKIIKNNLSIGDIIPTYNYWPIGTTSYNRETGYTDGGTLDNTGVLGILAQTDTGQTSQDPISLIVFDNTNTPLKKIKNGNIIAAGQIAPLFGIDFNTKDGSYQPFTESQKNPGDPDFKATSLIGLFNNNEISPGNTPFNNLVNGLYAASCGAYSGQKPDDLKINTNPAFYQIKLTTIQNSLANISANRQVNILYIQNTKILNWQNNIGDSNLKNEIREGQKSSIDPFTDFKNFPYYSTSFKIGLKPKESNMLAQMWAWAISDTSSPLKTKLIDIFKIKS